MRFLGTLAVALTLTTLVGCAADTPDGDDVAEGTDALSSLPTGSFAIHRKPSTGSYVQQLTLQAGKKFELEYVRRSTSTQPWIFNPWLGIPTTTEEAVVLRGKYVLFDSDGKTHISLDFTDGNDEGHMIFGVEVVEDGLSLSDMGKTFVLERSSGTAAPTEKRVVRCEGNRIKAVITLDQAQRRRGTMKITRKASADAGDPPNGSFPIVFTGRTGVDDYMAYEGSDSAGNGYDFAMRERQVAQTSGEVTEVGIGFTRQYAGYAMHHSVDCSVGVR